MTEFDSAGFSPFLAILSPDLADLVSFCEKGLKGLKGSSIPKGLRGISIRGHTYHVSVFTARNIRQTDLAIKVQDELWAGRDKIIRNTVS